MKTDFKTDFFKQIATMDIEGNLQLNITKEDEKLIVSVFLQNENCGDNAKNFIPPLVLKGTAEELDNGFFENIVEPIEATSGLMVDMENYLQAQEKAERESAMEKEKEKQEAQEKAERKKKFDKAMEKVEKLAEEKKYRQAWTAVPNSTDFPEFAEKIKSRQKELEKKFQPDLFQTPTV